MDYAAYWQLNGNPFEERCDPRFFFESEEHREALDRMRYVVSDRSMDLGLLTGEIGCGKTMVRTVLAGSLSPHRYRPLHFDNSDISSDDMLYHLLRSLESDATQGGDTLRGDRYLLMQRLRARLEQLAYREKLHAVALFDEAQQMSDETLAQLRNLINLWSATEPLMSIVLIGQPELREKVRRVAQIDQRIFLRFHINNLDFSDTVRYIQHRMRVSGRDHDTVFTDEAYQRIFRGTLGIPRAINRLCTLALMEGMRREADQVTDADIDVVVHDLAEHG